MRAAAGSCCGSRTTRSFTRRPGAATPLSLYSPDAVPDISDTDRADRLERMQAFTAIRSLARLIDAKEPMAEYHSERVATFVQPLAEAAGWPLGRIAELADAALIHDVGKISVPDDVLCKPAALTPAEYGLIKPHAALGAQMATRLRQRRAIPLDRAAPRAVRWRRLSERSCRRADHGGCRSARVSRQLGRDDNQAPLQSGPA